MRVSERDEGLLLLCLINIFSLLVGKYSIYRNHFSSRWVLGLVVVVEQATFIGLGFVSEATIGECLLASVVGSYVSAALWDSRSFNIESMSWRKKLIQQAFYAIVTCSILLVVSGTVGDIASMTFWAIALQLVVGVLFAEITYSVCKRNKLLSPAWRGVRLESRYDSRLSSTLTTPTSDRVIRI